MSERASLDGHGKQQPDGHHGPVCRSRAEGDYQFLATTVQFQNIAGRDRMVSVRRVRQTGQNGRVDQIGHSS